jgi:hypothetical protein
MGSIERRIGSIGSAFKISVTKSDNRRYIKFHLTSWRNSVRSHNRIPLKQR